MLRDDPDRPGAGHGVRTAFLAYYGVTPGFVVLDLLLGVNVRLSFLDAHGGWRLAYYGILLVCFAALLVRPRWTDAVSAVESLVTITALIFSVAYGSIILTDGMLEGRGGYVTTEAIVNLLLSGPAAYVSWTRSLRRFATGRD